MKTMNVAEINELLAILWEQLKAIDVAGVTIKKKEGIGVTKDFEDTLYKVKKIFKTADEFDKKVKEKVEVFLKDHRKLDKYEGDRIKMMYMTRRTKEVTGTPDSRFFEKEIKLKPKTQAINAYEKEMGKLPEGIGEKVATYPRYDLIEPKNET